MDIKNAQTEVRDWMMKFGQEVKDKPVIPSLEVRKLRAKLILEEALETIKALGFSCVPQTDWREHLVSNNFTLPDIADGIADSLVVLLGTAVACGIDIAPVFEEVMRSNHSKLWTLDELNKVDEKFYLSLIKTCVDCNATMGKCDCCINKGSTWIERHWLVKDKDGKVIKSPSYSKADIEGVLKKQGYNIGKKIK